MSRPKLKRYCVSQALREQIIIEVEKTYCIRHNLDYAHLQELKDKVSESVFRQDKLGADWYKVTGRGKEYLRQNLYDNKHYKKGEFEIVENLYQGLKKYLDKEIFDALFEEKKLLAKIPTTKEDTGKQSFLFYYYDEKRRSSGVSKGLMTFDEKQHKVIIKDKAHENRMELHYEGSYQSILNDEMLLMTLNIKLSHQRDLHIILHIGNYGQLPNILLGQYHNIDHKNTIVSGSILCVKEDHVVDYDSFVPKFYNKGTQKYLKEVPSSVRDYLFQKLNNRIKVPKGIFSLESLLDQKERKRKTYVPHKEVKKVFLSTPSTSLKNEADYVMVRKEILKIKALLKQKLNFKCYCALEEYESLQDFKENNILFDEIEQQLDVCDLFIMIVTDYTRKRISSSFVEFGYALNRNIFCTVFVQKDIDLKELLPNLMEGAITNKRDFIRKYKFEDITEIHTKINKNGHLLFGNIIQ